MRKKSEWDPKQVGELLGFLVNLEEGVFQVPARRVQQLQDNLHRIASKGFFTTARSLARVAGLLVSMGLALGPVARLWTRGLYRDICNAERWDVHFAISEDAQQEILFWLENFDNTGYPMWSSSPKVDVLTYSDASDDGWGGFAVQLGDSAAVGSWSLAEQDQSSTFRELRATRRVLESLAPELKGHEVLHRTDNQNTEHILTVGSRKNELHYEAIQVYKH